jgi:uncharacterized linocin/CFP29 family protein
MKPLRKVGLEQGTVTKEEFEYVEAEVVEAIRPRLIGRRIFEQTKLPDAGYMQVKWYEQTDMSQAIISMYGEVESEDKVHNTPTQLPIPIISKDYWLHWREVLAGRHRGEALDVQNARNAARQVAEEEDKLLLTGEYTGWPAMGIQGLSTATGRSTQASAGAWPANAITDINAARSQLQASGFVDEDMVMIAPPAEIKKLDAQIGTTGFTYRKFLLQNELLAAIYESSSIFASDGGADSAVIVVPGKDNFDLVIAQNVTNWLWQGKRMNYFGRVYEALVPRIKRAESICEITTIT